MWPLNDLLFTLPAFVLNLDIDVCFDTLLDHVYSAISVAEIIFKRNLQI